MLTLHWVLHQNVLNKFTVIITKLLSADLRELDYYCLIFAKACDAGVTITKVRATSRSRPRNYSAFLVLFAHLLSRLQYLP